MLPNMCGLALAPSPTGVTLNPDGSVTLTTEEYATLKRRAGEPSAPIPAPEAPPASWQRNRTRWQRLSDILKSDELASILGAIGMGDQSKASACEKATAWCVLNREHKEMCDSHPREWAELIKRIFAIDDASTSPTDEVLGEGLIYHTFRDDPDPQRAFKSMCGATGLADVLAKRFVMYAVGLNANWQWEQWKETCSEEFEGRCDFSEKEADRRAKKLFPELAKEDEWKSNAEDLFYSAPSKELYNSLYRIDPIFVKVVNVLFVSTGKSLFKDEKIDTLNSSGRGQEPTLEAFQDIGKLLGVYIVCLWTLEKNVDKLKDSIAADALGNMHKEIRNLRVKIVYAQDLILDPTEARENTDFDTYDTFRREMYEYVPNDEFDG